jgi:hypothetical protein
VRLGEGKYARVYVGSERSKFYTASPGEITGAPGLVGVKPEEMELRMPLQVEFDDVTAEVTLPKFRRA